MEAHSSEHHIVLFTARAVLVVHSRYPNDSARERGKEGRTGFSLGTSRCFVYMTCSFGVKFAISLTASHNQP